MTTPNIHTNGGGNKWQPSDDVEAAQLVSFTLHINRKFDDDNEKDDKTLDTLYDAIERCFGTIGRGRLIDQGRLENSAWYGVAAEILTSTELAEKWLHKDGRIRCGWSLDGKPLEELSTNHADNFDHVLDERVQAREEDFAKLDWLLRTHNGDVMSIADHLQRMQTKIESQRFLVPGLIPCGVVTLLLGAASHGKSAVAKQLAVAIATGAKEWLGFPLDAAANNGGLVLYCCGEDSEAQATEDMTLMAGGIFPPRIIVVPASESRNLGALLKRFKHTQIALLIIDPARVYLDGDEDSSAAVSAFFDVGHDFASVKGCPTFALHHLKRNAPVRYVADIANWVRGSQVFIDRPRVLLGLLRKKGLPSEFGICSKNGLPKHNFAADTMFVGVRHLSFDEATKRHLHFIPEQPADAAETDTDETMAAALVAVARLIAEGERVTRSNKRGLFEMNAPELEGVTRARVRAAVDALIQSGQLACDDTGALFVVTPPDASG
jgi:hypothetical protein